VPGVFTGCWIDLDESAAARIATATGAADAGRLHRDLRLHFGLGQAKMVDLIEVKWPTTQKVEKFSNIEANQFLTIKEGAGIIKTEKPHST
jgi:ASPIC and UnbV